MRLRAGSTALPYVVLAVGAIALRAALVLRSAGFSGYYSYDPSVYYAAASALVHGRVPYSGFVLLHPPAVMLALVPSAVLGHLSTDHTGYASGNALFLALGGVNAALVMFTARRWGLPRWPAFAGGAFYAVWLGAAAAEYSSRLEPLGNLFLLLGLAALGRPAGTEWTRRALLLGGAGLGLALSTKIWFAVPVVVVAWVVLRGGGWRGLGRYALGVAAVAVVVDGPFLVLSHGTMFSRVVTDQLGRAARRPSPVYRMSVLSSFGHLVSSHTARGVVATAAAGVLFLAVVVLAARRPATRPFVLMAVANVLVLMVSPSWFSFYADFAAVPVALCVAAAAMEARPLLRVPAVLAVAGAAVVSLAVLAKGTVHATSPLKNERALIAAARPFRCVMSDSPAGLIELNKLDSGLHAGCANWVDVTGRTYFGRDNSAHVARSANRVWQRDLLAYLRSGQAAFVAHATGTGLTKAGRAELARGGVLARGGSAVLYATPHHLPAP